MPLEIVDNAPLDEMTMLLREYADSLPFEVPDYDDWIAELPGEYTLLLARVEGAPAACACFRELDAQTGELKRMYVRDAFRGQGIARALVDKCIALGRAAGHTRLRLDTHSSLTPARTLYESFGFKQIPAYWDHPIDDAVFYELDLTT
jgi:carbonic anhydrase